MPKSKQGFATLSPERLREIARRGGIAAHAQGTGHKWTAEEAREAGRLGGIATGKVRRKHNDAALDAKALELNARA